VQLQVARYYTGKLVSLIAFSNLVLLNFATNGPPISPMDPPKVWPVGEVNLALTRDAEVFSMVQDIGRNHQKEAES
jgi:hypothetical protein